MPGPEVARAYVTIVPSLQGAQQTITQELTGAASPAGSAAGKAIGTASLASIGKSFSSAGKTLTKSVTVPLTAIGVGAVAAWKEVDSGLDTIATKTGATGEQLAAFGDIMNNIATTIPVGFEDAGAAIGEVNTRFGVTGDELQSLSTQFLEFADINDMDVSTAVDNTSKVLAAFGLDVSDAGTMLDAMNVVGQTTGVSIDTLSSQLYQNAAQFSEMGMTASDAAAFLGAVDMAGLDTSTMMMGLKTAMKNATESGVSLDEALASFTTTMEGNGSESDKLAAAYELFGTRAGGAIYNAVSNGTMDLENFTGSLEGFEGSVASTFESTIDPLDQFTTSMNNLKIAGAELVNAAAPLISALSEALVPAIQSATQWFTSLDESQQQNILKIAGILALAGPVLSFIGSVGTGISTLTTTVSTISTALSAGGGLAGILTTVGTAFTTVGTVITGTVLPAIGAALAAIAPALPIIAAVAAAIAAVILVVKNWGAISEWFSGVWSSVTSAVSSAAESVKTAISNAWENVKTKTSEAWENVKSKVSTAWSGIKSNVSSAAASVKSTVSTAWSNLKSNTSTAWSNIKSSIQSHGGGIRGVLATAVSGYQSLWTAGFSAINSITGGRLQAAYQTVSNVLGNIKSAFSSKLEAAKSTVSSVIEGIKGLFNFSWSLPHLALPHFSFSGRFSLNPPSVPHLSVSWYKRAAEEGALFSTPQIIGVGDAAQPELLIGEKKLKELIGGGEQNIVINVYGAPGQDINALAEIIERKLASHINRRRAAFA